MTQPNFIALARKLAGRTVVEMAELLGEDPAYLQKLESNPSIYPDPDLVVKLAHTLGLSVHELVTAPKKTLMTSMLEVLDREDFGALVRSGMAMVLGRAVLAHRATQQLGSQTNGREGGLTELVLSSVADGQMNGVDARSLLGLKLSDALPEHTGLSWEDRAPLRDKT